MGSKFGWLLAGLVVLAVALYLIVKLAFPGPSEPEETRGIRLLALKDVNFWPLRVVGPRPALPGDGGEDYYKAVSASGPKAEAIARLSKSENLILPEASLEYLEEIDGHVARGARKAKASYASRFPEQIRVAAGFLPAKGLKSVHDALKLLLLHYIKKPDLEKAREISRHAFIMGWHLMKERGHANITWVGVNLQYLGLGGFEYISNATSKDQSVIEKIRDYQKQLEAILACYRKKVTILHDKKRPNPGDVFNIAENDKDHGWRVQAIQMLGVVKFSSGHLGDRRYVRKLISKFSKSDDKLIAAAAKAAANFTKQDFDLYRAPLLAYPMKWPPGVED
ncbi:MAG: hypothetical protein ACYTF6_05465 [Planctomycetota bacterium]|jgi:hypothetical protein